MARRELEEWGLCHVYGDLVLVIVCLGWSNTGTDKSLNFFPPRCLSICLYVCLSLHMCFSLPKKTFPPGLIEVTPTILILYSKAKLFKEWFIWLLNILLYLYLLNLSNYHEGFQYESFLGRWKAHGNTPGWLHFCFPNINRKAFHSMDLKFMIWH